MNKFVAFLSKHVVFIVSITIALLIIILGYVFSSNLNDISNSIMGFVSEKFGWVYLIFVFFLCIFLTWLAFSKYGKIKLGNDNEKPEYSNFSWYAMLFCGGTGIGLVFWSIAEPLSHYVAPPTGIEPGTIEAANFSIRTCFMHWGITQWACFAIVGLALAYFTFRKNKKGLISSLLSPLIGDKASNGIIGKIIDIFSVVVSFAGVATSLGLGVSQICGGLNHLYGIPNNQMVWLIIIAIITVIFLLSAISGINKGIKFLSNINTYIALALLFFGFVVGPKTQIFNNLTNGVGQHLQHFIEDSLMIDPFGDNEWVMNWRIFYFAWFIAWAPFVGMFIARISRGRTIKEFIIGVVLIPTVFTIIWLSVFGTIALSVTGTFSLAELQKLIASPETAVFIVFEQFPLSKVLSILVIILLSIFFITSADSATYSLSMMTSGGDLNPPWYKKIIWALIEAAMAFILLSAGSLKPLQTVSVASSLPFLLIMILMCPALLKELKKENKNVTKEYKLPDVVCRDE